MCSTMLINSWALANILEVGTVVRTPSEVPWTGPGGQQEDAVTGGTRHSE